MHLHTITDEHGETVDYGYYCSDACNGDANGDEYQGWNWTPEVDFTRYCENCGVVIPGEDSCQCQAHNVVVNRFLSDEGEKCEHGNWIQVPKGYLT